jgi:RIP metalloprotease RseP
MTYSPNSNMGIFSSQEEISNVIQTIRKTPEGEPVRLTIVHGKDPDQFKNKEVVSVNPKRSNEGIASIGVMLGPNYLKTELIKANSPIDAISKAASALYIITSQTASSIFGVFVDLLIGKGVPAGISMSGPIGVVKAGADVVSSSDFAAVVAFAAGISVNLAVINSLPLPALDGGQLVFVLAEAISARKIDQRLQEGINAGALLILLFVSFGTAVGDVTSLFSR